MKNQFNSNTPFQMQSNNIQPPQQPLRFKRYEPKTPPIIEIYDLETLEYDSQNSSLSSSSSYSGDIHHLRKIPNTCTNFSNKSNNYPVSLYSESSSTSSSPRSSIESSHLFLSDTSFDEPFTFQGIFY